MLGIRVGVFCGAGQDRQFGIYYQKRLKKLHSWIVQEAVSFLH